MSKSEIFRGWKRRNAAGNHHISIIEGVNSVIAQRLAEEGIDSIEQLALIDPEDISIRAKYPLKFVIDWKDQAILYLLTGDIILQKNSDPSKESLFNIIDKRLGIRSATSFVESWSELSSNNASAKKYLKGLGLLSNDGSNFEQLEYLFSNITRQTKLLIKSKPEF